MESLSLFRAFLHPGSSWALHSLGECALAQSDFVHAQEELAAALAQFCNLGDRARVSWCLASFGSSAALAQQPERAARLWGAAEQLRITLGCGPAPATRVTYERALAIVREQLGEGAFSAAWAAGQALLLESAIAEALAGTKQRPAND